MVITVTLNPAVDRIIKLDRLNAGRLNRVQEVKVLPGGKGINVALFLHALGREVEVTGILGGQSGAYIENELRRQGIPASFTWARAETRTNIKIIEENGRETEINEAGRVTGDEIAAFTKILQSRLSGCAYLVLAGSLPRGASPSTYGELMEEIGSRCRVVVDTYGRALKEILKMGPYMIKPNRQEAEEIVGHSLDSISDYNRALDRFLGYGIRVVVISLGGEGALFATEKERFLIQPPPLKYEKVTVGAGDSLVAGMVSALADNLPLRQAALQAMSFTGWYLNNPEKVYSGSKPIDLQDYREQLVLEEIN